MSAISLTEAKTHLNITVATYDVELQTFIDAAEAAIGKRVGPLVVESVTERVRGAGGALVLNRLPVVELTTVTSNVGDDLTVGDLFVAASGVVEYAETGSFPAAAYTVSYEAGWGAVTEDVWDGPADLRQATLELLRHFWLTQRGSGSRPGAPASTELSNTLPGAVYALPFRVEQLLVPYALPGFA